MSRPDPDPPLLLRAARRIALVVGVGALGAVVCSTGVHVLVPAGSTVGAAGGLPAGATSPPPRTLDPSERRALALLRRAGLAEVRLAYEGVKSFGTWSSWNRTTTLAFIRHTPGQGTSVVVSRGAQPGQASVELLAEEARADLDQRSLTVLTHRYRLAVAGTEELLARTTTRIDVSRLDGAAAGRFWIDDRSGLILRRELLDDSGAVVRQTSFIDLEIGPLANTPRRGVVARPTPTLAFTAADGSAPVGARPGRLTPSEGVRRDLSGTDLDRLRRSGWVLPDLLPSGMVLICAREVALAGGGHAVQLSYSDGLFSLSVFAQHGWLDHGQVARAGFRPRQIADTAVQTRSALYRELTWAGGDTVYTVITDAPDTTVEAVVRTLPHQAADDGVLGRMSRGVARVGSWVNPFS